jgi:hypothetical protein
MEIVDVTDYNRRLHRVQQAAMHIDRQWIADHLEESLETVANVLDGKHQSLPLLNGIERILIELAVYTHRAEDHTQLSGS